MKNKEYLVRIKVEGRDKEYFKTIGMIVPKDGSIFLEMFGFGEIYTILKNEKYEVKESGYEQYWVYNHSALLDRKMIVGTIFFHEEKDNIVLNLDVIDKKIYVFPKDREEKKDNPVDFE